jgi:protein-disulfide isomerase
LRIVVPAILLLFIENSPGYTSDSGEKEGSLSESLRKMSIPDKFQLEEVILGDQNAPHTVIIYSSFTCAHCREFHLEEFPKFKKTYVDTGKVKVYLRNYLDDQGALESSTLVRCLGGDSHEKIVALYHRVFEKQKAWIAAAGPAQFLKKIFIDLGYDQKSIEKCLLDTKISAGLMKEQQRAMLKYKISIVPTFIVDGKIHQGKLICPEVAAMLSASE